MSIKQFFLSFKDQSLKMVLSLVIFCIILGLEVSYPKSTLVTKSEAIFEVLPASYNNIAIQYDLNQKAEKFTVQNRKAPKNIFTGSNSGLLKFFDSVYIGLDSNTQINTLIFTKDRYHANLSSGQMVLDTNTSNFKTTMQVGNILINPYLNGIFYLAKIDNQITVQVAEGNAEVQVYSDDGLLKRKFILSKSNQITAFDSFAVEGEIQIQKPVADNPLLEDFKSEIPNTSQKILADNVFTVKYKGQELSPSSRGALASVFSSLSFNKHRKNYNSITPFYIKINQLIQKSAKAPITEQDTLNLNNIYLSDIANNLDALEVFRKNLTEKYAYVLAVSPNDNLYQLKLFLLSYLNQVSPASIVLTQLNDLYVLYPESRLIQINSVFENLTVTVSSLAKNEAANILTIIDNLAETTIQANTRDLFEFRDLVSKKLTTTIEKAQYRIKTQQHLVRLQNAYTTEQLSVAQVRSAAELLISTLDATSQADYQDFLLSLN